MKLYIKKRYISNIVLRLLIFIEIKPALINLSNMYYDDKIFLMKRKLNDKKLKVIKNKRNHKNFNKIKINKINNLTIEEY